VALGFDSYFFAYRVELLWLCYLLKNKY